MDLTVSICSRMVYYCGRIRLNFWLMTIYKCFSFYVQWYGFVCRLTQSLDTPADRTHGSVRRLLQDLGCLPLNLFMPFPHELDQSIVDVLWVAGAQKVCAVLHGDEVRFGSVDEHLNFLLRVRNGINHVVCAM